MMIGALIVATLLGALLYSGKAARGSAPFVNGTGYIDSHLVGFRQHVNKIRAGKCMSRYPYQRSDAYIASLDLGSPQRRFMRLIWKVRHWRAHEAPSRCWNERMWDWYETSGAACIRQHEGAWTDPNAPYWGGFQADLSFQQAYGADHYRRWGTADNWPPVAQIQMAYRGWRARGWHPWPTTARMCGLL